MNRVFSHPHRLFQVSHECAHITFTAAYVTIPTQSRVVIAGAGVVANSVAYHLVQSGWNDITVVEQRKIGSGTSHFGSGTLGLFKPISHRNVIWYSINLYKKLQNMGYDVDLKQCGSLNLAQTKDRLIALKRRVAYNIPTGLHCELLSRTDIQKIHPYIKVDDLEGAAWVPDDAVINPKAICDTLALLAQKGGAKYIENTTVKKVLTNNDVVYAVEMDKGIIHCEYFVNCAGMWARELGLQCSPNVRIPAYPAEHFYATTGVLDENMQESLPIIRDYDNHMYAREYNRGLMVGWFEREAKPAFEKGMVPKDWKNYVKQDRNHFRPLWESAINRFPILEGCPEPELVNSPDNFTPDGRWILGEAPEVKNYFVACGMNGNSLKGAGGIGKAVAEWIIEGQPRQDLLPFILQRFLNVHNSRHYLKQRIKEVVGRHYSILYPFQCEYKYARELRCSPLYSVLQTRGAVFGIKMAYERALYFDTTYEKGHRQLQMPQGTFFKPKFFDFVKEEYLACIEGVGIIDMSSFSKIEIKSPGNEVVQYLQKICSNDIDIPVGTIVHTGMQNIRGGYENDCMLVRQSPNSYFMVSPTSQQTRVYEWMRRNLPNHTRVVLNDVTSMYTVLNVVGPKSIQLLTELSNSDFKMTPFSYMKVNVGYASDVMVMSFTHTGEPGYCLYIPSEYALHVYYKLMTVGRDYGVRDVGVITQRYMRLERFIPFWAEELNSFTTPFEAGNDWSVKLDKKENFIGKEALLKQSNSGVRKRLVFFHFNDIDPDVDIWPWGGEPLYRNNEFVGTVTSAGYGFGANKLICLGFITRPAKVENRIVTRDYILAKDASYEVDIAGHRFSATPYLHAPTSASGHHEKKEYRPTPIKYKSDISH
ncbi:pyruvate dehydrogenase phosphatase regulatory subunit, mitochondrial-like isoform X1 [Euwallacea similis]|uniref:pyruvate dehydrogenase phosphatase regulatory subunit, mitochondrial-like isoform X1 n=1 Tax=Euwallacea similis TaxID=1736056 RepID=UPI00344EBFF0